MSELEMKYFVLKPRSKALGDPYACASRVAMLIYAEAIKAENPMLALELEQWCHAETKRESETFAAKEPEDG